MNARRQGTHSSLTRGEVAMTGAKAWRQKGTGRARVGALSVPHRRGGGNAFATKPRNYTFKVNRKARRKALRAALSVHADRGSIAVLPADAFAEPATKQAAAGLAKWGGELPALIVITGDEEAAAKSYRNLPRVSVATANGVGVAEIIGHRSLIASEGALEVLAARAAEVERGNGEAAQRGERRLMDPRQVIVEPVVSEKSYALMAEGKYTFRVNDRAHKTQISHAVERDLRRQGRQGQDLPGALEAEAPRPPSGKTRAWKKAVVELAPGDQIELFEGAAEAGVARSHAYPQDKANQPRSPLRDLPGPFRGHDLEAEQEADQGQEEHRRP